MTTQDDNLKDTEDKKANEGMAGGLARAFIQSPLSPLLFFAFLFMGMVGLILTPRQEDPQISVPMIDIMVMYPGAAAEEVASKAIDPLERLMSEIPGVNHVYSASMREMGIVTVQFYVGEMMNPSLVKLHDKLQSNMDAMPDGVMPPLVKPKSIDDVSVVNLTLWSKDSDRDGNPDVDDNQLRVLALDVLQSLKQVKDTGLGFIVGGRPEQVRIEVQPDRIAGFGISMDHIAKVIQDANVAGAGGGDVIQGGTTFKVDVGGYLKNAEEIRSLVIGNFGGSMVYIRDVAQVTQEPAETDKLVTYYTGPAYEGKVPASSDGMPGVTIAIAKKEGSNGITVADEVIKKAMKLKDDPVHGMIPGNVEVSVTRNYGQTAKDKVNELIMKLFKVTGIVVILVIWAFRAFKPALVVALVIPVVILFTVFMAFIMGYSIDRVSLFALIFSIGILVDDAIVVLENIYRRWLESGETSTDIAVDAVREVGNPTILATFTVIAALLPMGFVRGMMGPYMEPIPALGSVAMLFSLFAAFMFTPWLAYRFLPKLSYLKKAEKREHADAERLEGLFRTLLLPLIKSPAKARMFKLIMWGSLIATCMMFYTNTVRVKMLPLDNKPEYSVVINMPEGTALTETANFAHQIATKLREVEEVTAIQTYVGTAKPFDFNGMVRHYYLRREAWQAEVQVQLLDKTKRDRTSHELAVEAREFVTELVKKSSSGVRVQVVEMPPGPPVLQTMVAEIHGPDAAGRRQVAKDLTKIFAQAANVTDVDNYLEEPYSYKKFVVDTEKASRQGVSVSDVHRNINMAMGGFVIGAARSGTSLEQTSIVMQVPLGLRSDLSPLLNLPIRSQSQKMVPLGELGQFVDVRHKPTIYHKDLRPVEYVTGEVHGDLAAPVYGMLQVGALLENYKGPDGQPISGDWLGVPNDDDSYGFEWGGEWTVTFETFRDMGIAFCVAMVLIYMLVVWEFGNFRVPAVIMAPIPLTLLGIIPGHLLFNAEFTATSMIGWIALAGIIVRNSILLVDYSVHQVAVGESVIEAVIGSCKTRTRPIVITALALVAGASVIISDPIFNGMAISLMFGVLVSTVLTLIVIPLGCVSASDDICKIAGIDPKTRSSDGGTKPSAEVLKPAATATPAQKKAAAPVSSVAKVDAAKSTQTAASSGDVETSVASKPTAKASPKKKAAKTTKAATTKTATTKTADADGDNVASAEATSEQASADGSDAKDKT